MYTPNEWTVIRQGLDLVTITGKNAKDLAALQIKVEKDIQKSTAKKEKELHSQDLQNHGKGYFPIEGNPNFPSWLRVKYKRKIVEKDNEDDLTIIYS